jgi:hypothetical protein
MFCSNCHCTVRSLCLSLWLLSLCTVTALYCQRYTRGAKWVRKQRNGVHTTRGRYGRQRGSLQTALRLPSVSQVDAALCTRSLAKASRAPQRPSRSRSGSSTRCFIGSCTISFRLPFQILKYIRTAVSCRFGSMGSSLVVLHRVLPSHSKYQVPITTCSIPIGKFPLQDVLFFLDIE